MAHFLDLVIFAASFAIIALAAQRVGHFFSRVHLPLISGFLFAGILVGPHVLGLIDQETVDNLRFVDEISLAVIAFAAGSELYIKEMRSRVKSIAWALLGNVIAIPVLVVLTFLALADFVPFLQPMSMTSRLAVALLAGAILIARSPSSAIAIVDELRARGPFTQTVLGVTMISDVVVIIFFALSSSLADALLTDLHFDVSFLLLIVAEFALEVAFGYLVGRLLAFILSRHLPAWVKEATILASGYGIFLVVNWLRSFSHANLPFEIFLEPLLVGMIATFVVANFTPYRAELRKLLEEIGPPIYIAFFTLTGASLALDVLVYAWSIALALFAARLIGLFIGSFGGGVAAGDPMKHNRISWLAYITQAGVGLGLAKEVAVEFPGWGDAFAATIIAVIVLSQLVGPPAFKWAITKAGEAHPKGRAGDRAGRRAVIIGLDAQSVTLARLLQSSGWGVIVASRHAESVNDPNRIDIEIRHIAELNQECLRKVGVVDADAVVTMLSNDENYRVCELLYENFGVENVIARLTEAGDYDRFQKLDVTIVEPSTAIAHLLDHFVRSPSAASLLLGLDKDQTIAEVQLQNIALHGMALRELRLPIDALILSVRRKGSALISHGYTQLELGDWVTIVGSPESVDEVINRFGPV